MSAEKGGDETRDRASEVVEQIFLDWAAADERGEAPAVEDLLVKYPRHAEQLAHMIADYEARLQDQTRRDVMAAGSIDTLPDTPRSATQTGQRIGDYEVIEFVARGGGGTLLRARHVHQEHVVALKVVDGNTLFDKRDLERFRREAQMLRRLDLVGVMPVFDTGEHDGKAWMALKWIDGANLAQAARAANERGHILHPLERRVALIARIARTFQTIHDQGILHRDIKPSNILVDRVGEPIIIDFGISRSPQAAGLTGPLDAVMGTPRYLAPEVVRKGNDAVSPVSDVYGLGLTLHELLVGRPAYDAPTAEALFAKMRGGEADRLRRLDSRIPGALEAIVARAIHPDPARRHPSMAALAEDLEAYQQGHAISPATARIGGVQGRALLWLARRRSAVITAASVLLIVALTWTGIVLRERWIWSGHAEAFAPYSFMPLELRPEVTGDLAEALIAVRNAPGRAPPRLREDAACWLLGEGNFEAALAVLGGPTDDELASTMRLREIISLHIEHNHKEANVEGATFLGPDGEIITAHGAPSEIEHLSRSLDFDAAQMRRRRRCRPLSLDVIEPFLAAGAARASDPRTQMLEFALLAAAVPTGWTREAAGEVIERLRSLAQPLLKAEAPIRSWCAWYLGIIELAYGDPQRAETLLEQLAKERPELPQALYGLALAISLEGEGDAGRRASDTFRRAVTAFGAHAASGKDPRRGVFTGMPWRRLLGHWASHELAQGRPDEAGKALRILAEGAALAPPGLWQIEAVHGVIEARVLAARGQVDQALQRIERARDANADAALLPIEQERIAMEAGLSAARVRLFRAEIDEADQPEPATLEDLLSAHFFGLRPFARVARYGSSATQPR